MHCISILFTIYVIHKSSAKSYLGHFANFMPRSALSSYTPPDKKLYNNYANRTVFAVFSKLAKMAYANFALGWRNEQLIRNIIVIANLLFWNTNYMRYNWITEPKKRERNLISLIDKWYYFKMNLHHFLQWINARILISWFWLVDCCNLV
jgi:uncharacterized MAPEG superfamily protein